jgi:hypothetical protein
VTLEHDDLDELASEVRRLIQGNKEFLQRVLDEDYDEEDESEEEPEAEPDAEDFEEL